MKRFPALYRVFIFLVMVFSFSACVRTRPIPDQAMDFEPGMEALADNLAGQLEKSSVGNMLNKVIVNPLTKQKSLKKIVIDPFIDADSGYPVKVNAQINTIMSAAIAKRFAVTGELDPKNLEVSEYVLCGMVSRENQPGGGRNA